MIRKICTLALCAVMVLPPLAMAENTVEILPTTPPMPRPVVEANPYGADDLNPSGNACRRSSGAGRAESARRAAS